MRIVQLHIREKLRRGGNGAVDVAYANGREEDDVEETGVMRKAGDRGGAEED